MFSFSQVGSSALHYFIRRLRNHKSTSFLTFFLFIWRFATQRGSASCVSIFFWFHPTFFSLLLIICFHLLFYIFLDCAFEKMSTKPDTKDIYTFFKIFHPILFCLLAIDTPESNWNFSPSFTYFFSHLLIRVFYFLSRSIKISVLCK